MLSASHPALAGLSVAAVLDAIEDPLLLVDGSTVVAANAAASALFGPQAIGAALGVLLPGAAEPATAGSGRFTLAVPVDGSSARRHWDVRVTALGTRCRLFQLVDRTATEAAERMRVDFVANASHELRTPIAAISGFAETLADDDAGGDPDTRRHFVGIIAREAGRMQRLVEELMSLSRIEAERHLPPTGIVDLAAVAREAALHAAEQRMPRGEDLVLYLGEGPHPVRGDAPQLAQLVHNLVSNGFKYGRVGTPVTLSLTRDGERVRLTVADEGEGIPPAHLPRITQRFYRVDARRSRAVGGTGLGLAIVKHIVERHGGALDIASEVDRGTSVTVTLAAAGA